ncbi:MAG: phosphate propanoyltransferase [Gaiellales bacterium]
MPVAAPTTCACETCLSVSDWSAPEARDLIVHMVRAKVEQVLREQGRTPPGARMIPVEVSARHIHITHEHLRALFGPQAELTKLRDLLQPGEFASHQTVTVVGPTGRTLPGVRILGPYRTATQVELARTDAVKLGMDVPMRASGDVADTPAVTLVGPSGTVRITSGVVRANRHIHMSPEDAAGFGVEDNQYVRVHIPGPEGVEYPRVQVRVHPGWELVMHLDTDDANAAGIGCTQSGVLITNGGS